MSVPPQAPIRKASASHQKPFQSKSQNVSTRRGKKQLAVDRAACEQAGHEDRVFLVDSELGWIGMIADHRTIKRLTFGQPQPRAAIDALRADTLDVAEPSAEQQVWLRRLVEFASGKVDALVDLPIDESHYTAFQRRVIRSCRAIPYGETVSYGELARAAGSPHAARAVGTVMSSNRYPLIVPCHRVVAAAGRLGGYSGVSGVAMKTRLLQMEAASIQATGSKTKST